VFRYPFWATKQNVAKATKAINAMVGGGFFFVFGLAKGNESKANGIS